MRTVKAILAATTAAAALLAFGPALADVPRATVEGVDDADLLRRLRQAVGEVEAAPATRIDARRRARDAADRAEALLRSEGWYQAEIEADVPDAAPPRAVVRITPGERFRLSEPSIEWLDPPASAEAQAAALQALALEVGSPGRAADVIAAEGRAVASLNARGYADAVARDRRVVVDHAAFAVDPTYRLEAGDLVRLDGVRLLTTGRTRQEWVRYLAPWRDGEVYDPEDVAELERRLLDTQVYDSVTVSLSPRDQRTAEGLRPVLVSLADRPRRVLEAGAGYSTDEGFGFDGRWTWYNRFGRADTLDLPLRLAQIEQRVGAELSLPHWRRPAQTLRLSAQIFNENTDAYERAGVAFRTELQRRRGRLDYTTFGAELDFSSTDEVVPEFRSAIPVRRQRDVYLAGAFAAVSLDRSDDPLDPTVGWRLLADVQPTGFFGDDTGAFVRTQAQGTLYQPFGDGARTVVAGRLRLGTILGAELRQVPSARRFYSGGGGSVRGYEYQGIGPKLRDGTPVGGLSLFETSLEVRRKTNLFGGRLGAVAFVDGGSVGVEEYPDFGETQWAAGVGARFDLGFAPIRADLAVPLNPDDGQPAFQLYVSIGQAF